MIPRRLAPATILLAAVLTATGARAGESWRDLFLDAKPILDVRYRYEWVDQDGVADEAHAHTIRTRAGLETGRIHGFGAGFDVEWIAHLGDERFNDTLNGKTQYPVVADPDDFQLNQLYLIADGVVPDASFALGRQRIIWDDSRFVGNVGFRQNEQTFDAFRASLTAIPDMTLEYVYFDRVNRIFGTDSPVGDFAMSSHGFRARYTGFETFTITPFGLLLDYDPAAQAGLDSQTFGVHLDGKRTLDADWTLLYSGSLARQSDWGDNPADFDLWYYRIEPGASWSGVTLKAGYEVLEGDGTSAFQTPLATLHKFNGFTDKFLTTPTDGLTDLYASLDVEVPGEGWLSGLSVKAGFHEYHAENGGDRYGSELDLGVFKKLPLGATTLTFGLQYASYSADEFASDTDKLWLTVQVALNPTTLGDVLGD